MGGMSKKSPFISIEPTGPTYTVPIRLQCSYANDTSSHVVAGSRRVHVTAARGTSQEQQSDPRGTPLFRPVSLRWLVEDRLEPRPIRKLIGRKNFALFRVGQSETIREPDGWSARVEPIRQCVTPV